MFLFEAEILPFIFHWVFGDGQVSSEENPTHTYLVHRKLQYTVTLTVSGRTLSKPLVVLEDQWMRER